MVSLTTSASVFACYSAACRPPTSGGTGGSGGGGKSGASGARTSSNSGAWTPPSPKMRTKLLNRDADPKSGPRPPEADIKKVWGEVRRDRLNSDPNDKIFELSASYKGPTKFQKVRTSQLWSIDTEASIAEAIRRDLLERHLGVQIFEN